MFSTPGAIVLDKKAFGSLLRQHQARRAHLDKRMQMLRDEQAEVNRHMEEQMMQLIGELQDLETREKAIQALHETL